MTSISVVQMLPGKKPIGPVEESWANTCISQATSRMSKS